MAPFEVQDMTVAQPTTEKKLTAQQVLEQLETKQSELIKRIIKMDLDDPDWDRSWMFYQSILDKVDFTTKYYM